MKWSKLERALEDRLANSLKGRLQFHAARYGPGLSYTKTRVWIALDGNELINFSEAEWIQ